MVFLELLYSGIHNMLFVVFIIFIPPPPIKTTTTNKS